MLESRFYVKLHLGQLYHCILYICMYNIEINLYIQEDSVLQKVTESCH